MRTPLTELVRGSVRRSSPTAKRPRTRLDWTDLGPDCSPGPTLVLSGPVLVLKILWDVKDRSWTSPDRSQPLFNRGIKLVNLAMTSLLNPDIIPLNLVIISSNLITTVLTLVIDQILDRKHIYCLTPTGQTVWHQYWKMFEHFERGGGETYCIAKGW